MFQQRGIIIAEDGIPITNLPRKTGVDVFNELGGRYLLKYILSHQVGSFVDGAEGDHWFTPTAYAPTDAVDYLVLRPPNRPREFALLLNPRNIPGPIFGPQWIAGPGGIQYFTPSGFPARAIVVPGAPTATWEIRVR